MRQPSRRPTQKNGTATPAPVDTMTSGRSRRSTRDREHEVAHAGCRRLRVVGWCTQVDLLVGEQALGVGQPEARPAALVLAPPRPELHELREVTARRAHEQHAVRLAGRDRGGAAPASTRVGAGPVAMRRGRGRGASARMATSRSGRGTRRRRGRRCRPRRAARACARAARAVGAPTVEDDDHRVDERAELDRLGRREHRRADDDLDVEAGVELGEPGLGGRRSRPPRRPGPGGRASGSRVRPCTSRGSTSSRSIGALADEHLDVRRRLDREVLGAGRSCSARRAASLQPDDAMVTARLAPTSSAPGPPATPRSSRRCGPMPRRGQSRDAQRAVGAGLGAGGVATAAGRPARRPRRRDLDQRVLADDLDEVVVAADPLVGAVPQQREPDADDARRGCRWR